MVSYHILCGFNLFPSVFHTRQTLVIVFVIIIKHLVNAITTPGSESGVSAITDVKYLRLISFRDTLWKEQLEDI